MSTLIICPACQHQFATEDAIAQSLEKEFTAKLQQDRAQLQKQYENRENALKQQQIDFDKKKEKENQLFLERIEKEKLKLESDIQEKLRKSIGNDFANQIQILKDTNKEQEEKLKNSREKELEFLRKEKELKDKAEEMEIEVQKKIAAERSAIAEGVRKQEKEKNDLKETEYALRMRELEKQLDDQKKLAEEMKRKAEQGSMQLQGEVQETALEEILKNEFPFDIITEVGKGMRGADCVQVVRNNFGQNCGTIIYESKRAENFNNEWLEKLKKDMRAGGADVAVLVTKTMPKDLSCFGLKEGIWICTFSEVKALTMVLREGILKVFSSIKSQENKGDKMHMLYDYLTSHEFSEQWKAIREGFVAMRMSIIQERNAMEKLWKAREKQLEKVLLNASLVKGSIEGIAGKDTIHLDVFEDHNLLENN